MKNHHISLRKTCIVCKVLTRSLTKNVGNALEKHLEVTFKV